MKLIYRQKSREWHPKRRVYRRLQKTDRDGADVTWRGRAFQVRAAAIGKARSQTVTAVYGRQAVTSTLIVGRISAG